MIYRDHRLKTFEDPIKIGNKSLAWDEFSDVENFDRLIDSGFYYNPTSRSKTRITCAYCGNSEIIKSNKDVENINTKHLRRNSSCPMSLIANIDDIITSFNQNRDELKNFWTDHEKFNDPFQSKTIEFRKQFYVNYPLDKIDSIPNSNSLSHAGFIYSPRSIEDDRVRCMYCQCALDYWEEDDDPIQEHIRNESTYCYFLDLYNNEQDGDKDSLELENPITKSINDIDHEEGNIDNKIDNNNDYNNNDNDDDEEIIELASFHASENDNDNKTKDDVISISDDSTTSLPQEITNKHKHDTSVNKMNDSFSTPVKDISQDLSIIEQDERPTYRRSKRIKRLYGEKDRNVDYWDKLPDEDLLQEFIEVSQKSSQHNNSKRKSSIINKNLIENSLVYNESTDDNGIDDIGDIKIHNDSDIEEVIDNDEIPMDEIEIEMEDVYVEENKSNDLSQQKQQAKDTTANGKGEYRLQSDNVLDKDKSTEPRSQKQLSFANGDDNEDKDLDIEKGEQAKVDLLKDINGFSPVIQEDSDSNSDSNSNSDGTDNENREDVNSNSEKEEFDLEDSDDESEYHSDENSESYADSSDELFKISGNFDDTTQELENPKTKQRKSTSKTPAKETETSKQNNSKAKVKGKDISKSEPKKPKRVVISKKEKSTTPLENLFDNTDDNLEYDEKHIEKIENEPSTHLLEPKKLKKKNTISKKTKSKTSEQKQIETKQLEPTKRKFEEPNTSPIRFLDSLKNLQRKRKKLFKPNILDMSFETAEVLSSPNKFLSSKNETGVNVKDDSSPEKTHKQNNVTIEEKVVDEKVKIDKEDTPTGTKINSLSKTKNLKNSNTVIDLNDNDMVVDPDEELVPGITKSSGLPNSNVPTTDANNSTKEESSILKDLDSFVSFEKSPKPKIAEIQATSTSNNSRISFVVESESSDNDSYSNYIQDIKQIDDEILKVMLEDSELHSLTKVDTNEKEESIMNDSNYEDSEKKSIKEQDPDGMDIDASDLLVEEEEEAEEELIIDSTEELQSNQKASPIRNSSEMTAGNDRSLEEITGPNDSPPKVKNTDTYYSPDNTKELPSKSLTKASELDITKNQEITKEFKETKVESSAITKKHSLEIDEKHYPDVLGIGGLATSPLGMNSSLTEIHRLNNNNNSSNENDNDNGGVEEEEEEEKKKLQPSLKWQLRSMSQFIEQTKFLESSANELKDLACSEYDLHDDVTGDLTKFIAEMPEEEEEMTIKQWIEHCAANCKDIVTQSCTEINDFILEEYDRAIKMIEEMPTED